MDRLGITTEQAPPFAPSAKGTVEALFTWTTRKFEHRLAGTTKDRGAYDSVHEAKKAGMTLDVLEELFIQAIVDGMERSPTRDPRCTLAGACARKRHPPLAWITRRPQALAHEGTKSQESADGTRKSPVVSRTALCQSWHARSFAGKRN